jgi:tRNA pseudouridine55 synthase
VRSYRLARRGETVELPEVEVTVHALACLGWAPPRLDFRADVSTGTYIRALGRDIAVALGTVGHLSALRRERIGSIDVAEAVALDAVSRDGPLRPMGLLVARFPRLALDEAGFDAVRHGRRIPAPAGLSGTVALWRGEDVVAMGEVREGDVQPLVVLEAA